MQTLQHKLLILLWLSMLSSLSFAGAEYQPDSGILNLPNVRISPANAEPSCVSAKLQADNPSAPHSFQLSQLSPIATGLTQTNSSAQLLGEHLALLDYQGNLDLFDVQQQTFSTSTTLPVQRYYAGLGRVADKPLVFGGTENMGSNINSDKVWQYDLSLKLWSQWLCCINRSSSPSC